MNIGGTYMRPVILASASPRRKEILSKLNIPFMVEVSNVNEEYISMKPEVLVQELSLRKAKAVSEKHQDEIVIGADTVVAIGDKVLGKPQDDQDAFDMINSIQGRCHQVYTGVTICSPKGDYTFYEKTDVYVRKMSKAEIEEYIATGEGKDKAGSYAIQGIFGQYITKYEGDYDNVVGLPGEHVKRILEEL